MDKLKTSRDEAPDGAAAESIVTRSKSKRLGYLAGMGMSGGTIKCRQHLDQVDLPSSQSPAGDHSYDEDEDE